MFRVSAIKVSKIKSHRVVFPMETALYPPVKNLLVYNRIRERIMLWMVSNTSHKSILSSFMWRNVLFNRERLLKTLAVQWGCSCLKQHKACRWHRWRSFCVFSSKRWFIGWVLDADHRSFHHDSEQQIWFSSLRPLSLTTVSQPRRSNDPPEYFTPCFSSLHPFR